MIENPSVTVAITTHNSSRFIEQCFSDLNDQTFQDYEILIFDDCSTDDTRLLLSRAQNEYLDRLRVLLGDIPIGNPAGSRNKILDSGMINGKYIMFLDGDDRLEPDFLEKLYLSAERNSAQIAICAFDRIDLDTDRVLSREMSGFPETISFPEEFRQIPFFNTSLWNKLIRYDIIGDNRLPEFKVGEDMAFLLKLYRNVSEVSFVDDVLIHYSVHSSSIISTVSEDTVEAFMDELLRQRSEASGSFREALDLLIFLHIGLSMTLRAYDSELDIKALIGRISAVFEEKLDWFRQSELLKFGFLTGQGARGLGIWFALKMYSINCYLPFLKMYKHFTAALKIEIKF